MMTNLKKLAVVLLLTPILAACSDAPSSNTVEGLIESQYEQASSMVDNAVASAGNDEMANAMSGMLSGMMPKLEDVSDVNCDSADGKNTYRCTAQITQNIGGNSSTNTTNFLVYKVNDEWVLGN
ncbi:hypothetical protein [Psychrobacter sp. 72-O-c]|uniref:hypothetical protein n=1 Tax=Psychrobacter sp. 72-O-c TaxID=2774125 RepID=UPI001D0F73DE|nr:hypothetical protein [Psychrobacter sp. 72-O-c]